MPTTWDTFAQRSAELADISSALGLLSWDQQVMTPPKGHGLRGQALSTLASIHHERLVDPRYGEAVDALAADGSGLDDWQRASVRVAKRDRDQATRIPAGLVRRMAEQTSRTQQAWEEARPGRDWDAFRPHLDHLVALVKEKADALGHEGERYDALLDLFEPGMRTAELVGVLDGLRADLVPFVDRVVAAPAPDDAFLHRHFPQADQLAFTEELIRAIGFDMDAGRQDLSTHPFTGGPNPLDVRLTTRVKEDYLPGALFASLHEAGHGLYEQGLPVDHVRLPVCAAPSLGAHESQSRFWENVVGRSEAFWRWALPAAQARFPEALAGVDPRAFARAACRVGRSAIRVEADEVTYNLHVLVRVGLEVALFRDELAVADLPGAWRERYTEIVGYTPVDDLEGVLQDVHWSAGLFGYFGTYTLGNLYCAQLVEALRRDVDLEAHVAAGEFAPVLGWMRDKVHRHGSLLPAGELMRAATGEPLSHRPFMRYLEEKYGALYDLA